MIYSPLALIPNEKPKFAVRYSVLIILYLYHRVETQDSKRFLPGLSSKNLHRTSQLLQTNKWTSANEVTDYNKYISDIFDKILPISLERARA